MPPDRNRWGDTACALALPTSRSLETIEQTARMPKACPMRDGITGVVVGCAYLTVTKLNASHSVVLFIEWIFFCWTRSCYFLWHRVACTTRECCTYQSSCVRGALLSTGQCDMMPYGCVSIEQSKHIRIAMLYPDEKQRTLSDPDTNSSSSSC
jgi:hypothetical protein